MSAPRATLRVGYGAAQIIAPLWATGQRLDQPDDRPARVLVRLLGARQIVQAGLSWPAPSAPVTALGIVVDALHAATMAAMATIEPRWRRTAMLSALTAAAWAGSGLVAVRRIEPQLNERRHQGRYVRLRDRWAQHVATRLLPYQVRVFLRLEERHSGLS